MNGTATTPQEKAQAQLLALLKGETDAYTLAAGATPAERNEALFRAAYALTNARDEIVRMAAGIKRDLDSAVTYATGGSGILNGLGVLQGDGPRFDINAALFRAHAETVQTLLYERAAAEAANAPVAPGPDECDACGKERELHHHDGTGLALCDECVDKDEEEIMQAVMGPEAYAEFLADSSTGEGN